MSNTTSTTYNFPKLTTKDKGMEYHRDFTRSIVSQTINADWATRYSVISESYKFVQEGSNGELTEFLQTSPDGTSLPGIWLTLNTLQTKIDLLVGELEERGYEIKVRALNKEAVNRKLEVKEKLRVKRRLQQLVAWVEQQTGMPLEEADQYVPQTDAELDEYIDLTFKDKVEVLIETILKYLAERNGWDENRKLLFRDVLVAGRAFIKNEIYRGIPRSRRIDPLCMVVDPDCKTDTLEDATYFGEVEYLPLATAAERYNLTDEELEDARKSYDAYLGTGYESKEAVLNAGHFDCISGNRVRWFKDIDGQLRVLVFRGVWRDYKKLDHKHEKNEKYGTEHLQEITDKIRKKDQPKIITKKFEVWRQCTLVGGKIVREWGEVPNQARDLSDIETSEPPYKAWIPNFATGRGVSKVEQLSGLQLAKDIAMYNMNIAMTRAGAKGMIYDLAMVPEGWTPEQAMKYMKVFGVAFINSKESQMMPGQMNLFKEFDMTLSDSIAQYINIMQFYDSEMDKISGVSAERQGIVQGSSQAVGVTQASLFQSNLITAPLFKGFERFCSRTLNHLAKLSKVAWAYDEENFANIIGTTGVDFLKTYIDLELEEVGVVVKSLPPQFLDRQKLEQMIMIVLQGNPEFVDDALDILAEPDFKVAMRMFKRKRAARKVLEAEMAQAQQEQEMAIQDKMAALEQQDAQAERQNVLQLQAMKNESAEDRSTQQGRTNLSAQKLKSITELTKEKLKPKPTNGRGGQ